MENTASFDFFFRIVYVSETHCVPSIKHDGYRESAASLCKPGDRPLSLPTADAARAPGSHRVLVTARIPVAGPLRAGHPGSTTCTGVYATRALNASSDGVWAEVCWSRRV